MAPLGSLALPANAVTSLGKAFLQAIVSLVLTGNLSNPTNVAPSWPRVIALQHKIPDHSHCPNGLMVPAEATFLMHASVAKHYFGGGSYPVVGGAQAVAGNIAPVIRASDGEVFTYARVKEIWIENERVQGIIMDHGDRLGADAVVSDASAHLCLYCGFTGTAAELGIPKTNLWIYPTPHHEQNVKSYLAEAYI